MLCLLTYAVNNKKFLYLIVINSENLSRRESGVWYYEGMESDSIYDLVIVGAGPAGLTSAIYASCYRLRYVVLGAQVGGQLQFAPDILNYPGFVEISGKDLTAKMVEQVKARGGELIVGNVTGVRRDTERNLFVVEMTNKTTYLGKAVILATGTERKKLNIPGEVEYTSKGVHYCATCEKQDYDGKVCGIVGGANSALQSAVQISSAAKRVYIIYRGAELRGDPIWLAQIAKIPTIEVKYNTVIDEIIGDGQKVTGVKIQGAILPLDKVFVEIGGVPGTALVIPLGVSMDAGGYILVNETLGTNVPGIFAAGDLVSYGLSIEQISSAVGLGARAAYSAFSFLKKEKAPTVWGGSQIKR